jgi:hypothetical protein
MASGQPSAPAQKSVAKGLAAQDPVAEDLVVKDLVVKDLGQRLPVAHDNRQQDAAHPSTSVYSNTLLRPVPAKERANAF